MVAGLDPVRLGLTLLVISRPRPIQNLLAYLVGNLTACIPILVVPLMVLNAIPTFRSFAHNLANPATVAGSTVGYIQIGVGVLALSTVALMIVRFRVRRRPQLATPGGTTSTLAPDSNTPHPISPLWSRAQDAPTEDASAIRRLLGRAHNAWENGSLWVAVVLGLGTGPAPGGVLYILAIIAASGAAIATQVSSAIALIVGTFAVVEITLASYLAMPAKTQAVVRLLHDWALAHRRKVLVTLFAVVGVALVAQGVGRVWAGS